MRWSYRLRGLIGLASLVLLGACAPLLSPVVKTDGVRPKSRSMESLGDPMGLLYCLSIP